MWVLHGLRYMWVLHGLRYMWVLHGLWYMQALPGNRHILLHGVGHLQAQMVCELCTNYARFLCCYFLYYRMEQLCNHVVLHHYNLSTLHTREILHQSVSQASYYGYEGDT